MDNVQPKQLQETWFEYITAALSTLFTKIANVWATRQMNQELRKTDWSNYDKALDFRATVLIKDLGHFLGNGEVSTYLEHLQGETDSFVYWDNLIGEGASKEISDAEDPKAEAQKYLSGLEATDKPILIPITVSRHITWVLVDESKKIHHFDPKGRALPKKTEQIVSAVADALKELGHAKIEDGESIRGNHVRWQNDKHNCGRYGLLFAERIADGQSFQKAIQNPPTDLSALKNNLDRRIG